MNEDEHNTIHLNELYLRLTGQCLKIGMPIRVYRKP